MFFLALYRGPVPSCACPHMLAAQLKLSCVCSTDNLVMVFGSLSLLEAFLSRRWACPRSNRPVFTWLLAKVKWEAEDLGRREFYPKSIDYKEKTLLIVSKLQQLRKCTLLTPNDGQGHVSYLKVVLQIPSLSYLDKTSWRIQLVTCL